MARGEAAVLLAQMLEALAKDKTSGSWSRRRWNDRCYIVIRGSFPDLKRSRQQVGESPEPPRFMTIVNLALI